MTQKNRRNNVTITYNTSLPVIFGVKKYADALWKVCKGRDINVNLRTNLIKVDDDKKKATFQNLDRPEHVFTTEVIKVNFEKMLVYNIGDFFIVLYAPCYSANGNSRDLEQK